MDHGYTEVPFKGHQPSPWRIKPLPKFAEVPGRKFNGCQSAQAITNDGEPPTPPPSPMGTFKYPALFRGSNTWLRDVIVGEICKSTSQRISYNPDHKMKRKKAHPQTVQNFFVDIKPSSGKTKMYLWPKLTSINCPNLDLTGLLTKKSSAGTSKAPTNKFESVAKFSGISVRKKSTNLPEAGDTSKDMSDGNATVLNSRKNSFGAISNEDFDIILRHALSHDPVMARKNSTPRIKRSMTYAGIRETDCRMRTEIFNSKKLLD